jgi:hypothetical protein
MLPPSEWPDPDLLTVGLNRRGADHAAVRIYVDDRSQLAALRAALHDAWCVSVRVGDDAVEVSHPHALDTREELIELTFFVRAWQAARPGVEVSF